MRKEDNSKQAIIEAGLRCFADNGYKQASMDDVAKLANVSKGLIFHHFKSKKEFYIFLYNYATNLISTELQNADWQKESDFFDRVRATARLKISLMNKHPALNKFLVRGYDDKEEVFNSAKNVDTSIFFHNVDKSKFKQDIPFEKIIKLFDLFSKGFIDSITLTDFNKVMTEYEEYLGILKKLLYKEEYIND